MGPLKKLKLKYRMTKRLGAFARAREQGMPVNEARAYAESLYPPGPDDIAYEESERARSARRPPAHRT